MAILDEIKSAAGIINKIGNMELYQKILDIQAQAMDLMEKNVGLQKENYELKKDLEIFKKLTHERDAYWIIEDGKKDGPFCTRCWDAEKKLVRLHKTGNPVYSKCPNCTANPIRLNPELDESRASDTTDYDPLG